MSLLKSNRIKTLDSQIAIARPTCILLSTSTEATGHRFKPNNLSLASLACQISLAIGLSISLSLPAHAKEDMQPVSNSSDEYIYTPNKVQQNNATATETVDIDKISKELEKGSYQKVPLQNIIDPTTGVPIDDVYRIDIPEQLSLLQAQNILVQVSPKLASNNAGIIANELTSEATETLNHPMVFLRASANHYDLEADVDLSDIKNQVGGLAPNIPGIPPTIIDGSLSIPENYGVERSGNTTSTGLAVIWPVYTGGRTQAVTDLADARTDESRADALLDNDQLQSTLVERYFTAQLAMLAAYLREDALNTVRETNQMAQRYLEEGFISGVERLEAQTALAEAESEAIKARHDAQLAMTALQRLLRAPKPVKPTTPLFVSSKPLPPLQYFQDLALKNHPGLKKVDAKYAQAQSLSNLSDTEFKPTVSVFGYHEIDKDPSWIAGVSASWKLWGGLNKGAQHASGQAKMRQAQLAKVDVSDNILLLVEKNWQSVENARIRFQSLNSNVLLAQELLRYKQLGMKEGVNTALDVTTAQTKYLQAQTEQAAAANDYVQALAALMESIGTPEAFNEYMAVADIKLPTIY